MISFRFHSVIPSVFLAMACAVASTAVHAKDQFYLKLIPQDGQALTWHRGVASIDNPAQNSVVRVIDSRDHLPDNQTTFRVTILNTGANSVDVAPENIWIEYSARKRIELLSYEELEGRHRRDIKRRQVLAALGAAGSANGDTTRSFNYNGMTSDGTLFSGFGTYSVHDPNLAMQQSQQATAQNQATFNAIQVRQLAGEEALNGLLRQTTVRPGEITSGIVAFDPPRDLRKNADSETFTIVVKIGNINHKFRAMLIARP